MKFSADEIKSIRIFFTIATLHALCVWIISSVFVNIQPLAEGNASTHLTAWPIIAFLGFAIPLVLCCGFVLRRSPLKYPQISISQATYRIMRKTLVEINVVHAVLFSYATFF